LQLIAHERSECAELSRSAILTDAGGDVSSSSSSLYLRSLISKAYATSYCVSKWYQRYQLTVKSLFTQDASL